MRRRQLAIAVALIGVLLVAGRWVLDGRPTRWLVTADMQSFQDADEACGNLPGIDGDEKRFSATSDQPPGAFADGVHWTVEGRANADDVADCLRDFGARNVEVTEPTPLKSFTPTDP